MRCADGCVVCRVSEWLRCARVTMPLCCDTCISQTDIERNLRMTVLLL